MGTKSCFIISSLLCESDEFLLLLFLLLLLRIPLLTMHSSVKLKLNQRDSIANIHLYTHPPSEAHCPECLCFKTTFGVPCCVNY